ncbi:hypothetical protein PORY_002176 [Pneumocystis oryctolagi]|uniref:Uncharacterized protein n=1 Tax=Pneumocystis oryctolagi TaxID=42067 RepID=A0ACB7CA99_9ASCO|nr:hypothetical protein PORY_002176 [Pneumocystis oryctolagi]
MLSKDSKTFSVFNKTIYTPAESYGPYLLRMICHPDFIETIASYMHFKDLISLSCICRIARQIIYDNVRCWRVIDLGYHKGTILERYQNAKSTHLATFRTIQSLFYRSNIPFDRLTVIILDFSAIQYPAVRFIVLQAGLMRLKKISLRHCRYISLKDLNSILVSLQRVWLGETSYYNQASSTLAIKPYVLKELRVRYMKGLPKCSKDLYYNYSQYNLLYTFRNIAKLLRLETDVETCSMVYPNDLWHNREICVDYWNELDRMDCNMYYPIGNLFFDLNNAFRQCSTHPEIVNYKFCAICLQSSQCAKCGIGVCPFCQGVDQCNLFYLNVRGQNLSENAPLRIGFCQQCGILCKECRSNAVPNCLTCLVPYCPVHMSSKIKYCCEIGGEGTCNKCAFKKPWLKYCYGGCGRIMCKKEVSGKCFRCRENICWQCMKLPAPLKSPFIKISSEDDTLISNFSDILDNQNIKNMISEDKEISTKITCVPCKVLQQLRKRKLESRKFRVFYGSLVKRFDKYINRKRIALKLYKHAEKERLLWIKKLKVFHLNDENMMKLKNISLIDYNIDFKSILAFPSRYIKFISMIKVAIERELVNGINSLYFSKVSVETVRQNVRELLSASAENKRGFLETVELQIGLKNYDPQRDKRFSGTVRLPTIPRQLSICILADAHDLDRAQKHGVDALSLEDLKKLNKQKKLIKKLAKKYDAFLSSESLIKQIPRLLGPGLSKVRNGYIVFYFTDAYLAGKFPTPLSHTDELSVKLSEVKATIKFQLKKVLCLGVAVGNVGLTEDQLVANIVLSINFLVSLLKKAMLALWLLNQQWGDPIDCTKVVNTVIKQLMRLKYAEILYKCGID